MNLAKLLSAISPFNKNAKTSPSPTATRYPIGKKVWVIQYDDDTLHPVFGVLDSIKDGFLALRREYDQYPTFYINLTNVKQIEVMRENSAGEVIPIAKKRGQNP